MMIDIEFASITDRGLNPQKVVNEDSLLVMPDARIFAIADGVGGAYAGDVASQSAVNAIQKKALDNRSKLSASSEMVIDFVKGLIAEGNEVIYQLAQQEQREMASTIALMAFARNFAIIGHVGDSRVYVYRKNKLHQLTKDHSRLQKILDSLPKKQRKNLEHVQSNIITKALGVEPQVEPDLQKVLLKNEDIFILCTDGIYNHNSPAEMLDNLKNNHHDLNLVCQIFKENCYQKGANDHLTAIVLRIKLLTDDLAKTQRISRDELNQALKR
ncbi:MAG: PP2C family protein-serine/threonine phosphatase [bacterium]